MSQKQRKINKLDSLKIANYTMENAQISYDESMNNVVYEFQLNFGIYNKKSTWNTYLLVNSSMEKII